MKRLTAIIALVTLVAIAGSPLKGPKQVEFSFLPDPTDLGGLSTNAYFTNIIFRVYSSQNVNFPIDTWPEITNWLASTFPVSSAGSGKWTNTVVMDGNTRFYAMTAGALGGTNGPFSNVAVLVATPGPGTISRVGP